MLYKADAGNCSFQQGCGGLVYFHCKVISLSWKAGGSGQIPTWNCLRVLPLRPGTERKHGLFKTTQACLITHEKTKASILMETIFTGYLKEVQKHSSDSEH